MKSIAWWLDIPLMPAAVRKSKHSAKPFLGKVRLNYDSSLRKLMRAARQEKLPSWYKMSIGLAMKSAGLA